MTAVLLFVLGVLVGAALVVTRAALLARRAAEVVEPSLPALPVDATPVHDGLLEEYGRRGWDLPSDGGSS